MRMYDEERKPNDVTATTDVSEEVKTIDTETEEVVEQKTAEAEEMETAPSRKIWLICGIIAVAIIVIIIGVVAFSSKGKKVAPTEEFTAEQEETEEETVETAAVEEVEAIPEPTPEPTAEPTPEPTPEPIVYEGIDMESTLPGVEWIETFAGVIAEPKMVVFNDETNKKIIVENEQEITLESGDVFAVYKPNGQFVNDVSNIIFDDVEFATHHAIFTFSAKYFVARDKFIVEVTMDDDEIITLYCYVTPPEK